MRRLSDALLPLPDGEEREEVEDRRHEVAEKLGYAREKAAKEGFTEAPEFTKAFRKSACGEQTAGRSVF